MKKLLTILFTALLLILNTSVIKADSQHLFVDDDVRNTFNEGDEEFIEKELANIESSFGISIYYVFDKSIPNDEISSYANDFLNNHSNSINNIVLCMNKEYYSIKANGENSDIVLNNKDSIFNAGLKHFSDGNYYEGIIAYYQYVVKVINEVTYNPNVPITSEKSLLYDGAGLLNEKEKEIITNDLEDISDKYGMDFVVVTVNSLDGKDIQAYADDFYDYNGYAGNGVLFLIDMGSRQITISTKGECISIVDDQTIDYIFDDMMDDLKAGKYYDVFKTFYKDADYYVNHNMHNSGTVTNQKTTKKIKIGISLIVSAIVSLVTYFILANQLKSVAPNKFARNYVTRNSFVLTGYSNMLINKRVSKTPRPRNNNRSFGGSSGTSHFSHTSSSGSSHGGHSRGF